MTSTVGPECTSRSCKYQDKGCIYYHPPVRLLRRRPSWHTHSLTASNFPERCRTDVYTNVSYCVRTETLRRGNASEYHDVPLDHQIRQLLARRFQRRLSTHQSLCQRARVVQYLHLQMRLSSKRAQGNVNPFGYETSLTRLLSSSTYHLAAVEGAHEEYDAQQDYTTSASSIDDLASQFQGVSATSLDKRTVLSFPPAGFRRGGF